MKLTLSKKDIDIIQTALFEYSEICFDQGVNTRKTEDGCAVALEYKNSISYKLAVSMQKLSYKIYKQMEKV